MKLSGIIFDMDGVLIDSEKLWHDCEINFLRPFLPKHFSEEEIQNEILGCSLSGIFDLLQKKFPKDFQNVSFSYFTREYKKFGIQHIYKKTKLLEGARETLEFFSGKVPIALASSSPKIWISETLKRHSLEKFFRIILSGDEVKQAKPHPEIFEITAKKMNVSPQECIVCEDSKNGIESAKKAGMFVVGLKNGFNEDQDLSAADTIIFSLFEFKNAFSL